MQGRRSKKKEREPHKGQHNIAAKKNLGPYERPTWGRGWRGKGKNVAFNADSERLLGGH